MRETYLGFRVSGFGFRDSGLRFRVYGLGFGVWGLEFRGLVKFGSLRGHMTSNSFKSVGRTSN